MESLTVRAIRRLIAPFSKPLALYYLLMNSPDPAQVALENLTIYLRKAALQ